MSAFFPSFSAPSSTTASVPSACLFYTEAQKREENRKTAITAELRRLFHRFDREGKGFVNRQELKLAFIEVVGYKPHKYQLTKLLGEERQGLCKEEFACLLTGVVLDVDPQVNINNTFEAFDMHHRQFLAPLDLQAVVQYIQGDLSSNCGDMTTSQPDIAALFSVLDANGDGKVGRREFRQAFSNS